MKLSIKIGSVNKYGKESKILKDGTLYVYIGRKSKLQNPYPVNSSNSREDVISLYVKNKGVTKNTIEFTNWIIFFKKYTSIIFGCPCDEREDLCNHTGYCHGVVLRERIMTAMKLHHNIEENNPEPFEGVYDIAKRGYAYRFALEWLSNQPKEKTNE